MNVEAYMIEIRRATTVLSASALFLLLGVGSSQANECHEARHGCMEEAIEGTRVCRQECRADVKAAIEAARIACDEQSLDEEACRALVGDSVDALARECRSECHDERETNRTSCRDAMRECRQAIIDPLDDACVTSCREEFEPCREEQKFCHDECRDGVESAVAECRDAGLSPRETLQCMHEAHRETHSCVVSCHAGNACHGDLRECLSECPVEDVP
jgi:hypothetical protein